MIPLKERFEWTDYELTGSPTLSLDDYTIQAFGCDRITDDLLSSIKRIRQRNQSVRWILIEFWGRGKSTLMYNLCHEVNKQFFFSSDFSPMLALYVNYPRRVQDLLDYSYENGLPIPWTPDKSKSEVYDARKDSFAKALRMIAYAWVKKAWQNDDFRRTIVNVRPVWLTDENNLMQENLDETIEYIDSIPSKDKYDFLAYLLNSFFEYSLRHNEPDFEGLFISRFVEYFPGLLYPETGSIFLKSFSRLFGEPGKGLRDFSVFYRICELVNVHILIVIDEAEDWDYMTKAKLDEFLIEVLPTNTFVSCPDIKNRG